MKKLINEPTRVTREMLEGMVAMNPSLALLGDETVVIRSDIEQWRTRGQVALISGGGAGHEPAHAGYVGEGMLTAAVSGEVFTSPSTDAVLATIRACAGTAGVLLIIKNYTGDRLNFGLAAELARAEGIAVDVVIVADDAAFDLGRGQQPARHRRYRVRSQSRRGRGRCRAGSCARQGRGGACGIGCQDDGCCAVRLYRAGGRLTGV